MPNTKRVSGATKSKANSEQLPEVNKNKKKTFNNLIQYLSDSDSNFRSLKILLRLIFVGFYHSQIRY